MFHGLIQVHRCSGTDLICSVLVVTMPKVYKVTVMLAPEYNSSESSSLGGLGSLASMAGINLSSLNSQDAITPTFYPDLMNSMLCGCTMASTGLDKSYPAEPGSARNGRIASSNIRLNLIAIISNSLSHPTRPSDRSQFHTLPASCLPDPAMCRGPPEDTRFST